MLEWFVKGYLIAEGITWLVLTIKTIASAKKELSEKIIKWSWRYSIIGVIGVGIIFVVSLFSMVDNPVIIQYSNKDMLIIYSFSLFPLCVSIWLCCMSLNWSVELKESTFLYTNSFGIKREYRYDEFYSKPKRACWRYYKKGHKLYLFSISYMMPNSDLLEEKLQEYNMKKK